MNALDLQLQERLRDLGMSRRQLAQRSGVGIATVNRVLHGASASLDTLSKIAAVLGGQLQFAERKSISQQRLEQARSKAKRLVALVQGSAGLECQAVDAATLRQLQERTVKELLAGSERKLWADL